MTASSIPHSTHAARRRRKPDPQSVYQSYAYEVRERGQRYAAKATADRYGISDDTVRRIIAKVEAAEQAKAEEAATGLAYTPPPGGYPDPEPAAKQPQTTPSLTEDAAVIAADADLQERLIMSSLNVNAAILPLETAADCRSAQLENETPAAPHTAADDAPEPSTWATDPPADRPPPPFQPPPPPPDLPVPPPDPDWMPTGEPIRVPPGEEPLPAPTYPGDPLHPSQPATVDPTELPSVGPKMHAVHELPEPPSPAPVPIPTPLPDPVPNPTPEPVPPMPGPSRVIVRQVVRVPVEPSRPAGLVAWCQAHEAASKQLLAVAVFLLLVMATWLG